MVHEGDADVDFSGLAVRVSCHDVFPEYLGQMHFTPLVSSLRAMLARLPFDIAKELDPSAVHEQVQRAAGTAIRDLNS